MIVPVKTQLVKKKWVRFKDQLSPSCTGPLEHPFREGGMDGWAFDFPSIFRHTERFPNFGPKLLSMLLADQLVIGSL